jgi:predicted RNA binding protein with dsRBD fold (UPF0201 family)
MAEQRSFWQRFFGRRGTSSLSQHQQKVLQYILGRMNEGAPLQEVLQEEYVRRNCSRSELEQIIRSPELIGAAREQLGESFRSDEFKL